MANNTVIPAGSGGDIIRDLDRLGGGVKTQVTQIDIGGGSTNAEILVTAGQQPMAASLPVVIASNQTGLPISPDVGKVSISNSSISPLGAGGTFTGTAEDLTHYPYINTYIFSDQASAVDGLQLQQSNNGTNWDNYDVYSIPANTGKAFSSPRQGQFFRIVYTNGAVAQGSFRLQVIFSRTSTKSSSVRPSDGRSNDNDMDEVVGYMAAYDSASNTWSRVRLKPALTAAAASDPSVVVALSPNSGSPNIADNVATGTLSAVDTVVVSAPGTNAIVGVPTAGSFVSIALKGGANEVIIQLGPTGNFPLTNTVTQFEYSIDSTNGSDGSFYGMPIRPRGGLGIPVLVSDAPTLTTSGFGLFQGACPGGTFARVRITGSGSSTGSTAPVTMRAGVGISGVNINGSISSGQASMGLVGIDQSGTKNRITLLDAAGNQIVVKPASTAALTTDPSAVVAISPNSPVPIKGFALPGTSASIAATATGTIGPLAADQAGNCTFVVKNTVAANAYAGAPVIVFEQSDDNIQWSPLSVIRSDTLAVAPTFTLGPNTASTEIMFDAALEGVAWVRARVTTGPTTNAMTVSILVGGLPFTPYLSVVQQPVVKGVQGTTGVMTQDLKDAGRNLVTYYMVIPVLATATDTLQSLTGTKSSATVAATTTPAVVTAGKTFRVTRVAATYITTATVGYGVVRVRAQPGGVVTITSPVVASMAVGCSSAAAATTSATGSEEAIIPDGLEFPAGAGIGISVQGFAAATPTAVGYVMASLTGFEY